MNKELWNQNSYEKQYSMWELKDSLGLKLSKNLNKLSQGKFVRKVKNMCPYVHTS